MAGDADTETPSAVPLPQNLEEGGGGASKSANIERLGGPADIAAAAAEEEDGGGASKSANIERFGAPDVVAAAAEEEDGGGASKSANIERFGGTVVVEAFSKAAAPNDTAAAEDDVRDNCSCS